MTSLSVLSYLPRLCDSHHRKKSSKSSQVVAAQDPTTPKSPGDTCTGDPGPLRHYSQLGRYCRFLADKDKKGRSAELSRLASGLTHTNTMLHTPLDKKELSDMRWEKFVKLMERSGFTYHPNTAGSGVRFDPASPTDRSITVHKPHPDPMISSTKLKDIAKKLKDYYGWDEEEFLAKTQHGPEVGAA